MCHAGIFILNMMDHKWSAYHDISSTHVERTALKLFSYFIQSIFIYSLSIIYLSKNFEVMGMRCGHYLLAVPLKHVT